MKKYNKKERKKKNEMKWTSIHDSKWLYYNELKDRETVKGEETVNRRREGIWRTKRHQKERKTRKNKTGTSDHQCQKRSWFSGILRPLQTTPRGDTTRANDTKNYNVTFRFISLQFASARRCGRQSYLFRKWRWGGEAVRGGMRQGEGVGIERGGWGS